MANNITKKTFWDNPYLTALNTTVKTVSDNKITLNETIFYAFSGGQESDAGTIGGYPVLKAEKQDKDIIYTIINNHALQAGDPVKVTIDWERRYSLMRLHFAAEVVLELVCQRYPKIVRIGAHIAQDKARIDFEWDQSLSGCIAILQEKAQAIIDAHQPIISTFSDEVNERRYWKIDEFAQVPCGGTHVKNTSEIGMIKLKRANPGKGKERIEIFVSK